MHSNFDLRSVAKFRKLKLIGKLEVEVTFFFLSRSAAGYTA